MNSSAVRALLSEFQQSSETAKNGILLTPQHSILQRLGLPTQVSVSSRGSMSWYYRIDGKGLRITFHEGIVISVN